MTSFLSKWKQKEVISDPYEGWITYNLRSFPDLFEAHTRGLKNEVERFLYQIDYKDYHIVMKQHGYFQLMEAIQFKNEEDAMAFRLAFLE